MRKASATSCGRCDQRIAAGDPLLEIRLAGTLQKDGEAVAEIHVRSPLFRCAACAGEPVPADLPPLPARSNAIAATARRPQRALDFTPGGRS